MDWDSKLPPWDMAELEQNHMQSPNPMSALNTLSVGSSVSPFEAMVPSTGLSDCSIDLKLGGSTGRLVDLGVFQKDHHRNTMSTAKRPRVPGNQAQPTTVCCSVDGCESDLSNCRDYHRRHKVCEAHSKTPVVVVGGQEQRFCQQCSRFHMLSEFDEVKRSCRKRLDGHNRRRRKPQSDTVNNPSLFSASHQGSNFSNFPTIFPATLPDHSWIQSATKASQQNLISHHYLTPQPQQPFSLTFPQGLKEISKRFPFINESTSAETRNGTGSGVGSISLSVSQPLQNPIPISVSVSSESSGSSGGTGGANTNRMHYSERALSLLSSPPPSATVAAAAPDLAHDQPLFSNYRYGAVTTTGLSMEEVHDRTVFMSNSNSSNGIGTAMGHCNGAGVSFHSKEMYNVGHDEGPSIEDGSSSQPLQFWHQ